MNTLYARRAVLDRTLRRALRRYLKNPLADTAQTSIKTNIPPVQLRESRDRMHRELNERREQAEQNHKTDDMVYALRMTARRITGAALIVVDLALLRLSIQRAMEKGVPWFSDGMALTRSFALAATVASILYISIRLWQSPVEREIRKLKQVLVRDETKRFMEEYSENIDF